MTRKVVSNTRSIVVFRRIFLLLFFRDYRRRCMPAVSRIKLKFTGHAQQNAPLPWHIPSSAGRMKTKEVGKILVLLPCHIILLSNAIVLPNFYPFGVSEGDQLVPTNDDGSSGTIPISILFPFYDRNHNSLFVSMLIVFLSQKTEYVPLWYKHINNGAFHITNIIINVIV